MSMHWGWWVIWVGFFFVLAWFAFISAGLRTGGSSRGPTPRESVEEALRRRFAEGEIDEDEFDRRMKLIKESRDSP